MNPLIPFVIGLLMLLLPQRWAFDHLLLHERRAARWRQGAVTLGLVAAVLLLCFAGGYWLAGPVFGIVVLAGVLTGELLVPGPASSVRSATLTTRRVRDYLPRHRALQAVLLASLTVLLTPMTIFAASHPAGRDGYGRISCGDSVIQLPPELGVPAITVIILTVIGSAVVCLPVLRKIVNRPPVTPGPESEALDTAMREASAGAVFYAWSCLLASTLFTTAMVAHAMFDGWGDGCTNWWRTSMHVTAYLAMATGGSVFVYLLAKLIKQHSSRRVTA